MKRTKVGMHGAKNCELSDRLHHAFLIFLHWNRFSFSVNATSCICILFKPNRRRNDLKSIKSYYQISNRHWVLANTFQWSKTMFGHHWFVYRKEELTLSLIHWLYVHFEYWTIKRRKLFGLNAKVRIWLCLIWDLKINRYTIVRNIGDSRFDC